MAESSQARVLFVDDEPELLASVLRGLRSANYELHSATSGAEAIDLLVNGGPFAAIVSDLNMPGINGISLLRTARETAPDTVRVLFTGQADLNSAIAAVNDGAVFRFITKPCSRVVLALTVKAAVEHHHLITSERVLLEQTLHGSVRALTDILSLMAPLAFGRATRLRQLASALLSALDVKETWHIEVAAMLSQIGHVILPPAVLERLYRGETPNASEQAMLNSVPEVAQQILGHIPRLEPVLEILRDQDKRYDGAGMGPDAARGKDIPFGARLLKVVRDFDQLDSEGLSHSLALDTLRGRDGCYDPLIVEGFARCRRITRQDDVREIPVSCLVPGMILAKDLRTRTGLLFVARGQEVTLGLVEKLHNCSGTLQLDDYVRVIIRDRCLPTLPQTPAAPAA